MHPILTGLSLEFRSLSKNYAAWTDDPSAALLSEIYEWLARTIEIECIPAEMAHSLTVAFRVFPVATLSPQEQSWRQPLIGDLAWLRLCLTDREPEPRTVPVEIMLGILARLLDHGDLTALRRYRDILTEDWFHCFMWSLDLPSWSVVRHFPHPVA